MTPVSNKESRAQRGSKVKLPRRGHVHLPMKTRFGTLIVWDRHTHLHSETARLSAFAFEIHT